MSFKILGIGAYLPGEAISNENLEKIVDTTSEWIRSRTGILQRFFTSGSLCQMALEASLDAIKTANIDKSEIDLIIVCSTTPDKTFPSTATTIQGMLDLGNIPSFDLNGVCSGFLYGLHVAKALIETFNYKKILLVGADKMSSVLDMKERSTSVLFGDGAGAVILSKDPNNLFDSAIFSDGTYSEILKTEPGINGQKIYMKGAEVYKHAVMKMHEMSMLMLERNELNIKDIDFFVPHQANIRIIEAVAEKLGLDEHKIVTTVQHHANTSAATIPLALSVMKQKNMLKSGDLILMSAVGAGLTYAGSIIRY